MNTTGNVLMLVAALSMLAASQQHPAAGSRSVPDGNAARPLAVVATATFSPVPADAESIILPPTCDEEGNVYFRPYDSKISPLQEPIYKFSPHGERKAVYSVSADPEFSGKYKGGEDFALGKGGEVYRLALSEKGNYIVQFDQNGAIKSKIRLHASFSPYHFAVFDSGEFLITGSGVDGPDPHGIYTGIFDRSGKMVKKIAFPEDEEYTRAAERGDVRFWEPGNTNPGNFAVDRGAVVRAANGNLYVVRSTTPARVYAVSPASEMVANFEVSPPIDGKKPSIVVAHGSRLAIEWEATQNDPRAGITVVGLDGQPYAIYNEKLGTLVCYSDQERFTFLGGTELRFAQPR